MKILVTGATGFIGQHLVPALLSRGVSVIVTYRNNKAKKQVAWTNDVEWRELDIFSPPKSPYIALGSPDRMVHLAWSGLPNFKADFHLTENLPADKHFLESMIEGGLNHLLVAGTCFEYGMQEGELTEDTPSLPHTNYGRAKQALHDYISKIAQQNDVTLQWARLFYMYGSGQNSTSLFSMLQKAIDEGQDSFDMSEGQQVRDFLNVETLANHLATIVLQNTVVGDINVCSGRSVTVQTLVEEYLQKNNADIKLNLGVYPYPDWEPFRFWGNTDKLTKALEAHSAV